MPLIASQVISGVGINESTQYNTAIGGIVALIAGYVGFRRLHVFPGLTSGGYIIPAFSVTYGLLAIVLIMARLDYSRLQLLTSYVLTIGFFTYIHLKFVVRRPVILGVVPNGSLGTLPTFDRVIWHVVPSPDAPTPRFEGVVVDLHAEHGDAWSSRIAAFALEGTPVYHVKQAIEQLSGRVEIEHLSENTLGALNPNDLYLKVKGAFDMMMALIALAFLSPLLITVAILIRLDSPGPALFKQQRTGFRAKPFTVYKFRTMHQSAATPNDERHSAITQDGDPRITRAGALLRRTRLDELPQLLNILKGEMSMIGPRPEAVALTKWYEKEIPFYHYRHIIKPGISGWAQVNQGHVSDVNDVREKLNLDFYYVKNFSAWLDILIVLKTIRTMASGSGAK
ncbi:exopolysaccharide biosynthesis polyprenyl glycosylphosphotransferase [Sphingomonas naasensis]|nr:exopolysaccharide biosynthesis polyprenyl glycosylphosphotransferase [Sphingomonas naasensis]